MISINNRTQKGMAHLALILLLVVVAAIAVMGYIVYKNNNSAPSTESSVPVAQTTTINSKADLDKAAAALNSENVDSDLNPDSLDQDVNTLL